MHTRFILYILFILLGLLYNKPAMAQMKTLSGSGNVSAVTVKESGAIDLETLKKNLHPLHYYKTNHVKKMIDFQTLLLDDDSVFQLSGLYFPPENRLADQSQNYFAAVRKILEGKKIYLFTISAGDKVEKNRMGHPVGFAFLAADGADMQAEMIRQGYALPLSVMPKMMQIPTWNKAESEARAAQAGLWKTAVFKIYDPESIANAQQGQIVIVEGKVTAVANIKNKLYLNFRSDWRKDFTVSLDYTMRKALQKKGIDAMMLVGKIIQVRGVLEEYNGAYIQLFHPDHLQLITPKIKEDSQINIDDMMHKE